MEPMTTVALITAVLPFATAAVKKGLGKVFRTDRMEYSTRKGLHALLPVLLGIVTSGLYSYNQGSDWVTALAVGLGSGGAASSVRDIDKNLTKLMEAGLAIWAKRKS